MGRLIPAGTGLAAYKALNLVVEGEVIPEERYAAPAPPPPPAAPPAPLSAANEE